MSEFICKPEELDEEAEVEFPVVFDEPLFVDSFESFVAFVKVSVILNVSF